MSIFSHWIKRRNSKGEKHFPHLVIITGYYGFDNLGDEAILEELIAELKTLSPLDSIVVLSNNPRHTSTLYGVKSINRWHWREYLSLLPQAKLLISGGGGLFQDKTGSGSVLFYGAQILMAKLFAVPVLIYAQGIGPLQRSWTKILTQFIFNQVDRITVRDRNSLKMIESWGLKAELTADPVWNLAPAKSSQSIDLVFEQSQLRREDNKLIIAVSMRDDTYLKEYHFSLLAKIIASAHSGKLAVLLLPLQKERDSAPLQKLNEYLQKENVGTYLLDPIQLSKPSDWLYLMENIDLLIGMRLHALLMALKVGKPVIGIAYDPKVSHLLDEFRQPILSLNTTSASVCDEIWSKIIAEFIERRNEYAVIAQQRLNNVKELAQRNIRSLSEVYEVATRRDANNK